MSYQVNFRLMIPDCAYWEAEHASKLRTEIEVAIQRLIKEQGLPGRRVVVGSAEVSYLTK